MKNETHWTQGRADWLLDAQRPLLSRVAASGAQRIIECGCGFGLACEAMAAAGKEVTGIDLGISQAARAHAGGRYELIEGDWDSNQDLLARECWDAVYSFAVLEHQDNPIQALHEWGQLVKCGGLLFLGVPAFSADAVQGHISTGWSIAQVTYCLVLAGWDCSQARFRVAKPHVLAADVRRAEPFTWINDIEVKTTALKGRLPACLEVTDRGWKNSDEPINWPTPAGD
jgi:2-polyprenyl-3-methyl-5-hydroxy-6-metoxy-1,4-benzoquinol methylase